MDFELEQDVFLCYELVGQTSVCQEETQEAIVPDACPDILQLLDVCAQAFPERWEVKERQGIVSGTIQATLLYKPEDGRTFQKMELKIPFQCQAEFQDLTSDGTLEISARLRSADARVLNPRKVLLRVDLVVEISAFQPLEHQICSGVSKEGDHTICQLLEEHEHECLTCVPQRMFPISEEIRLSGLGGEVPQLLSSTLRAVCTESRVIGSKLIFKGKLDVDLLLQGQEGVPEYRTESFPFSQILEATGVGDSGLCQVWLEICSVSCTQLSEDESRVLLDAEILAQGQIRERRRTRLLMDLYSTSHHLQTESNPLRLYAPGETLNIPQTLRDLMETDGVVRSVCDCRFELGQIQRSHEGEQLVLTAQGRVVVRYLDENRQLCRAEKSVELPVRLNYPEQAVCTCRCICPVEVFAAPCAGGIEIRLSVEFQIHIACSEQLLPICKARLGEPRSQDSRRPSVILRLPGPEETLWDIAKACGTTKERIQQANELDSEELPRHRMLLIPSTR